MRKVYLMSPREPCGATWLINCFLELGIKTYRSSAPAMWKTTEDGYQLSEHEKILKKWLPALGDHQKFKFRDDIEVEWAHNWPTEDHDKYKVIYFARDPRDSLFSRYKREAPDQTFEEFLMFPDVNTLLDKAHNWRLFNLAWAQHPCHQVFRFEDYKHDAAQVLASVLDFLGLIYPPDDIQHALSASNFERAVQAEVKYRAKHPEDQEVINRSGKAGEWKLGGIDPKSVAYIESVCADAMRMQGYACEVTTQQMVNYSNLVAILPFFQRHKLPELIFQRTRGSDLSDNALAFAESLQYEALRSACLRQYEVGWLLDSLTILLKTKQSKYISNLKPLYRAFDLELEWRQKIKYWIKAALRRILKLIGKVLGKGK